MGTVNPFMVFVAIVSGALAIGLGACAVLAIVSGASRLPQAPPRAVCPRCVVRPSHPDGCGCYYRALRAEAEYVDIVGRLTKWQRGGA